MPLSRINLSATANRAAAFKLSAFTRFYSVWSQTLPFSAPHPTAKRCFGSRCHKAVPDHSRSALPL